MRRQTGNTSVQFLQRLLNIQYNTMLNNYSTHVTVTTGVISTTQCIPALHNVFCLTTSRTLQSSLCYSRQAFPQTDSLSMSCSRSHSKPIKVNSLQALITHTQLRCQCPSPALHNILDNPRQHKSIVQRQMSAFVTYYINIICTYYSTIAMANTCKAATVICHDSYFTCHIVIR